MTTIEWISRLSNSELSGLISSFTALVAVIVGPILQWKIAKRQAADNVSIKRQNWIDGLRKETAEFLTNISRLQELSRPAKNLSHEDQKLNFDEVSVANFKACELGILIKLRLNPIEDEHNKLHNLIEILTNACKDPPENETEKQMNLALKEFNIARNNVITQLQYILKQEWERVKNGT